MNSTNNVASKLTSVECTPKKQKLNSLRKQLKFNWVKFNLSQINRVKYNFSPNVLSL